MVSLTPSGPQNYTEGSTFTLFGVTQHLQVFYCIMGSKSLDGKLVHRRVTHSSMFAGTHFYTWVERGAVTVKYPAQKHNTMSPVRARTPSACSGVECTNQYIPISPRQ